MFFNETNILHLLGSFFKELLYNKKNIQKIAKFCQWKQLPMESKNTVWYRDK